jgi:hypothetical protein
MVALCIKEGDQQFFFPAVQVPDENQSLYFHAHSRLRRLTGNTDRLFVTLISEGVDNNKAVVPAVVRELP